MSCQSQWLNEIKFEKKKQCYIINNTFNHQNIAIKSMFDQKNEKNKAFTCGFA
jgi:hypothetical protein